MTLPNFIIIGVAKAATTSLYHYLDQHPQVYMSPVKETNYFGYEDGLNWVWTDAGEPPRISNFTITTLEEYESLFSEATDELAIGEASPLYLRSPSAARRIYECIPHAKIVATLRNPADRAFSGYMMHLRRGDGLGDAYHELTADSHFVKQGFYYYRLQKYFRIFSKKQIKVIIFEELKKDPTKTVIDLFDFLGVDTRFTPDTATRHNPAGVPRSKLLNRLFRNPAVIRTAKSILPRSLYGPFKQFRQQNIKPAPDFPEDLRFSLLELYRRDIIKLEQLLERDLSLWFENS